MSAPCAAPGTEIAAPGTEVAAPGTEIAAPGTESAVPPTAGVTDTEAEAEAERRVDATLAELGIPFQAVETDEIAASTAEAAAALGVGMAQIGKSLAFLAGDHRRRVVVVLRGEHRLSMPALAQRMGVSRRGLRAATPQQCKDLFGFAPGGVAPFAHVACEGEHLPVQVLVEAALLEQPFVFVSGGSALRCARVAPRDLLRVPGARLLGMVGHRVFPPVALVPASDRPFAVVDSVEGLPALREALFGCRRLAIDTEHSPLDGGRLTLMQFSTDEADLVVDVLAVGTEPLAEVLRGPLADHEVLKVLHGCSSDLAWIYKYLGLTLASVWDTAGAAVELKSPGHSLRAVVMQHLGVDLDKSLQGCDWAERPLTPEMVAYARNDSLYLLPVLDRQAEALGPGALERVMARGDHFIASAESRAAAMDYSSAPSGRARESRGSEPSVNRVVAQAREGKKPAFTPKGDVYGNYGIYNPDGVLMCRVSRRKRDWYLSRELATPMGEGDDCIQLNFTPKGDGFAGDHFALSARNNACVVCTSEELIARHHIVPHSHKKSFEDRWKQRWAHDIVLLCYVCKLKVIPAYQEFNDRLADEYVPPELTCRTPELAARAADIKRAHTDASALVRSADQLPPERRQLLRERVAEHLGVAEAELSDEQVRRLASTPPGAAVDGVVVQPGSDAHGAIMADAFRGRELEFIIMWRELFVETMEPKNLPEGWDLYRDDSGHV